MVASEAKSSCQLVVTFFFFFFFLVSPYQTIEISLGQPSPPSYQLLPPPLTIHDYPTVVISAPNEVSVDLEAKYKTQIVVFRNTRLACRAMCL